MHAFNHIFDYKQHNLVCLIEKVREMSVPLIMCLHFVGLTQTGRLKWSN